MEAPKSSEGVYFERQLYAGFWQRLAVDVIDVAVIFPILAILTILITDAILPSETLARSIFLLWTASLFAYFVLLKRSNFGTVGYKICKVRVINLHGERPGIICLTLRLAFSFIGPLSFPLDLIWISSDENRQALRDKFAKTYVIKRNAKPKGTGQLIYSNYDLWGWHFLFCEVQTKVPRVSQQTDAREEMG